jgi:HEAT repeats
MLQVLLAAAFLFPSVSQDTPPELPKPEVVEEAGEKLAEAYRSKKPEAIVAAMTAYGRTRDAKIVKSVAKGLKHKDLEVQRAAIDALRYNQDPEALKVLHKTFNSDKQLRKSNELYTALIKAICQHGDKSSLPLLSKNPLNKVTHDVARARILGYGMIRDADSVKGLMKLMQSVTFRQREPYMEDFRTSLYLLSGVDKGTNAEAWQSWWNKNKKTLKVSVEAPKLPEEAQNRWNRYWGLERSYERKQKRHERGDDPE